jgi:putative FmdB family regulatory protein
LPIYEYKCPRCNNKFDRFSRLKMRHEVVCPSCGVKADILISVCSASFGWRISDESINDVDSKKPDTVERNI